MTERESIYSVQQIDKAAEAVEQTRVAVKSWAERRKDLSKSVVAKIREHRPSWRRETYRLPRDAARKKAREFFRQYPKPLYSSEVENWSVRDGEIIEFTLRRLPMAD